MSLLPPLRFTRRMLPAVATVALLGACAGTFKSTPEELVRERAAKRWQALIAGDFQKAYEYLTPGSRAVTPYAQYRARIGGAVTFKSAEPVSVVCETSEKCVVKVKVRYEAVLLRPRLGTIERYLDETWLQDAGQWWFLYSP